MRTILIVGFDLIENNNSYLWSILFLFLIESIQYIFVLSLGINYYDNDKLKIVLWEQFWWWVFIQ